MNYYPPEIIFLNSDTVIVTGIDEFEGKIKNENDESPNIRGIRKKTINKIKIENDNSFNIKEEDNHLFLRKRSLTGKLSIIIGLVCQNKLLSMSI